MKSYYFIDKEGIRLGPLPLEDLISHGIEPNTLVWTKGMEKWAKAKDVKDFEQILSNENQSLKENSNAELSSPVESSSVGDFTGYKAPNAVVTLILGICSILFGCWIIGLVCGIIGIILSKKAVAMHKENPNLENWGMVKAGRITSIIGIVLGTLGIIWVFFVAIVGGTYMF